MNRATLTATSLLTFAAFFVASCSDLPPGQPGPFGNGAVTGGDLARSATVMSAAAQATGSTSGTVVTATIVILGKHEASLRQQQVAKANAKAAIARLRKQAAARPTADAKPGRGRTAVRQKKDPAIPRYLAVETVKDERTSPLAQKAIVIFDTETQEIVGNDVYDVKSAPPVGSIAKFETYTAEYVGSGF